MILDIIVGVIGIAACICIAIPSVDERIARWELECLAKLRRSRIRRYK